MDNPPSPGNPDIEIERSKAPAGKGRRSAAPLWLWALLLGTFTLIFWQFRPEWSAAVDYQPWFLDQVERQNIRSLVIRDTEIHGELRQSQAYHRPASSGSDVNVVRFVTHFPSSQSIEPVIRALRENSQSSQPVLIETRPPSSDSGLIRLILLFHSILILVLVFLVWTLPARLRR